jgi:hypothetical protein
MISVSFTYDGGHFLEQALAAVEAELDAIDQMHEARRWAELSEASPKPPAQIGSLMGRT